MPNGPTHRLVAGTVLTLAAATEETRRGEATLKPLAAGGIAALCGTLPDLLEPATHPNHRQFFHSWTFAVLLGVGWHKLYKWQPESRLQEVLRDLGLVLGGAYLVHLALDASRGKSLPLLGKV